EDSEGLTMTFLARRPVAARRLLFGFLTTIATVACLAVAGITGSAQQFDGMMQTYNPFAGSPDRARPEFNLASRPDVLDLESSLQRADLVVAAKLVEVTESRV